MEVRIEYDDIQLYTFQNKCSIFKMWDDWYFATITK